jgi:hypothetical protein
LPYRVDVGWTPESTRYISSAAAPLFFPPAHAGVFLNFKYAFHLHE